MAETPLEILDAAIEKFLRDTGSVEDSAFISGWTIAASTSRVQAEDNRALPLVTGAQYSIGPQTSITQFAGLVKFLDVVSERATWSMLDEVDED